MDILHYLVRKFGRLTLIVICCILSITLGIALNIYSESKENPLTSLIHMGESSVGVLNTKATAYRSTEGQSEDINNFLEG